MIKPAAEVRGAIRRLNLIAGVSILALAGGFFGWAVSADISGAVVTSGFVVVESNVKRVQHPTGGVIGQLLVREGDRVAEGDVLIRLDETLTRANLGIIRVQLDELSAREARLLAERDDAAEIEIPAGLAARAADPGVARALAGERRLIAARRAARTGQKAQLRERIEQLRKELEGLSSQVAAKVREIELISSELVGVTQLYRQNLVPVQRLMALQRDQARIQGEHGQYVAEQARARGRISEIEIQTIQIDQDFASNVQTDLRDAQGKIGELDERRVAAEDQLKRVDIRAPQAGQVHHLATHTVGGVIRPGDTLMEIVPQDEALTIEVRVPPAEIDQVAVGLPAKVKIMAGNQRTLPDIDGTVSRVAADLTRDQQGNAVYYEARVALGEDQMARLGGLKLVPGMPAEVFIRTGERTALAYLMKPLSEQVARTFRER